MVPGWIKGGLPVVLVLLACWGGAIWFWRGTDRMPATGDLLLYLLALPTVLLLSLRFGPKVFDRPAATDSTTVSAGPGTTSAVQVQPLAILAASLRTPHGASAEELRAAIADNKARPDLDRELVDDDGFPVTAARSRDAIDDALRDEIVEWLAHNGMAQLRFSDEQWRALTLASAVTGELASNAASDIIPAEGLAPMLHLVPLLPAEWQEEQRRAVGMWLTYQLTQAGWPAARIALVEVSGGANDTTPGAFLGRLAQEAVASETPMAALVVACASHIGDETIAQWAANGTLFTSSRPQGLVPGEGAAGLLVTGLHHARTLGGAAFAVLDIGGEARRDTSVDDARRTDTESIGELVDRALKLAAAERSDVAMIIADTGHRSKGVRELMEFAAAAMPQLDDEADVIRVGVATGACEAVPFIAALALGRQHVLEHDAVVLCIGNEDPYRRVAALIRPAAKMS
jgi:hypothetical protein